MANIVILGVYSTKSALDTAEAATANAGDTYLVGSKIPYDLYTFTSGAFKKGDKVSNEASDLSSIEIDLTGMFNVVVKDGDKTFKLRRITGRTLRSEVFELFGV